MATTLAIIMLALLVTGVAIATVYALPIIQQANAAQAQNGDMTQSQDRLRQRDCSQSGEMTQTQQRLQLRECTQNCDCTCEGPCASNQGDSETAIGNTYQNQFCEQACLCTQNRNRLGVEKQHIYQNSSWISDLHPLIFFKFYPYSFCRLTVIRFLLLGFCSIIRKVQKLFIVKLIR